MELSWCPSWSNSLWQGWSCRLVYCPGGNATEPIWRVLASSQGISCWTPLKPQYSNPNHWPINSHHPSQTPCLPWISYATQKLMLDSCKMVEKHSIRFCGIFSSLKHNFIAYRSSKVSSRPDCILEIHQLWQSDFSRVYSNSWCSCSFEPEIIKIGQSSLKTYTNNILNSQGSMTILNARTKKVWKLIVYTSYIWGELVGCWLTGWSVTLQ